VKNGVFLSESDLERLGLSGLSKSDLAAFGLHGFADCVASADGASSRLAVSQYSGVGGAFYVRTHGEKIRLVYLPFARRGGVEAGSFGGALQDKAPPLDCARQLSFADVCVLGGGVSDPAQQVLAPSTHADTVEDRERLPESVSRSRREFLKVALHNPWEWFCTLTLDAEKYDRFDLPKWRKDLAQWVRNYRRLYGCDLKYVFVPEQHKNGAWHMHGLLYGVPHEHLSDFVVGVHPDKLIKGGYKNWERCANKFGFVSLGVVRSRQAAAIYTSKYISKTMGQGFPSNAHCYYASQGLDRGELLLRGWLRPQEGMEKECVWDFTNDFCRAKVYTDWHELEQEWQVAAAF